MLPLQIEVPEQDLDPIGVSRVNKRIFINKNYEIIKDRRKELRGLQRRRHKDEATVKRIERLKQIVTNLQQGIKRTKAAISFGRPYGM